MKKDIYDVEGIQIEVERTDKDDKDAERRKTAYMGYLVVILAAVVSSLLDAGRNSLATFMLSR